MEQIACKKKKKKNSMTFFFLEVYLQAFEEMQHNT